MSGGVRIRGRSVRIRGRSVPIRGRSVPIRGGGIFAAAALLTRAALLTGAAVLSASAAAVESIDELYTGRWFITEVIVFERLGNVDTGDETLAHEKGRHLPLNLTGMTLPPEQQATRYPVNRGVWLTASLPTVQLRASTQAEPPQDVPPPAIAPRVTVDPYVDVRQQVAGVERHLRRNSLRWLPANTLILGEVARRIDARDDVTVLFHGAWQQAVPDRDKPLPILFREGPMIQGRPIVHGTLSLTVGRFLHLHARLWLDRPTVGQQPLLIPIDATGSPVLEGDVSTVGPTLAFQLESVTRPGRYAELDERRRMRSGELHYLDHPYFGLLVQVEPIDPPADLARLFEQIQEAEH